MKVFAMLGLATLVCAENQAKTVKRRRLALETCQFSDKRAGAHNPNCLGKWTWTMTDATREPEGGTDPNPPVLTHHDYRCCLNEEVGWTEAGQKQELCAEFIANNCDDIKTTDDTCRAADKTTTSFFSHGYTTTACTGFADDCRASVTCDTASGFTGTADLACIQGHNDEFLLRGCVRSDLGTLGTTPTKDVFVVRPHATPVQDGTSKSSFAMCTSAGVSEGALAITAGNGACDGENNCHTADICSIFDSSWDRTFVVSESEDTFLRPFSYKSQINEPCVTITNGERPLFGATERGCVNAASDDNTADYGGFDEYGDRFSCWRNVGGGIGAVQFNVYMTSLDLTRQVVTSPSNAGIAVTLLEYENDPLLGETRQPIQTQATPWGVWNQDTNNGWAVCTAVSADLGGCTAELAALMCEAYNRDAVAAGETDPENLCIGFSLQRSSADTSGKGLGPYPHPTNTYTYQSTHARDRLVGFFTSKTNDQYRQDGLVFWNWGGGYFKTVEVPNCLLTSNHNCMKCAKCISGKVLLVDGSCADACPQYQYSNNDGVCTERMPHCLEGPATGDDGSTCGSCRTGYLLNPAATVCEERGCEVPSPMVSDLGDTLTGAEQGGNPACVAGQNLIPGNACGVQCPDGQFSSDSQQTVTYSCPATDSLATPTIICSLCTVNQCSRCPSNPDCDVCDPGYVLSSDKQTCNALACLYIEPPATSPTETAGACTNCPYGKAHTLGWDVQNEVWDESDCRVCTVPNCVDCVGANEGLCEACASGYAVKDSNKLECIPLENCPSGNVGLVVWDALGASMDFSGCSIDPTDCQDVSQEDGFCTDCEDGFAGSVEWDFTAQEWNTDQCQAIACPVSTETSPNCNSCPEFQTGTPVWDDLFNEWTGCVANDFGFSAAEAQASWSVSVQASAVSAQFFTFATVASVTDVQVMEMFHVTETKTAEMFHVANAQFDTIQEKWVCDEGYAGVTCKQRLCPETVAFTSGTDGFTPSQSHGVFFATDAAIGTSATFNNQHSYRECGGRGTCDFETGICQCFPGFTGAGCRRTTCPNSCSGHGVCINDDVSNYHAAGNDNLPAADADINTWGNLWSTDKFQGCKCDGGWGGNDCSLRQCPRGDDPETQCADDLGNDIQYIECTNLFAKHEQYFKLRFTDVLGNRYNTRAIVLRAHDASLDNSNREVLGREYTNQLSSSIQTALESLPNFAIPAVEVTTADVPPYACVNNNCNFDTAYTLSFEVKFTDARNSGKQPILEVETDMKCDNGVQPKFPSFTHADAATNNIFNPTCAITRIADDANTFVPLRENAECSNRGLCNRKTAECNCFDGYTGLACDTVAQTY